MKPDNNENAENDSTEAGPAQSNVGHAAELIEDREPPTLQLEVPHGTFASPPAATASSEPAADRSASLEDRVKKGAKGYLLKVGKLMILFAIIGSLLLVFAAYMISSTLNNIVSKIEQH